jgi:hypothetical protein
VRLFLFGCEPHGINFFNHGWTQINTDKTAASQFVGVSSLRFEIGAQRRRYSNSNTRCNSASVL